MYKLVLLFLCLLVISCSDDMQKTFRIRESYKSAKVRALLKYEQKDYDGAYKIFAKMAYEHRDKAEPRIWLGRIKYEQKNYAGAYDIFVEMVEDFNKNADVYEWLGRCHGKLGSPRQELKAYIKAVEWTPGRISLQLKLADYFLSEYQFIKAEYHARLALKYSKGSKDIKRKDKEPTNYDHALATIAICRLWDNDFKIALSYARQIPQQVTFPHLNYLRAYVLFSRNRPIEAKKYLADLVVDPLFRLYADLLLAKIYIKEKNYKQAKDILISFADRPKFFALGELALAEFYFKVGNRRLALKRCDVILRQVEQQQEYFEKLVLLLIHYKRYDEAFKIVQKLLPKYSKNAVLHLTKGYIFFNKGLFAEASKDLLEALNYTKRDRVQMRIREKLVFIFLHQRKNVEAISQLEKMIEKKTLNIEPYLLLCRLLRTQGKFHKALTIYNKANNVFPKSSAIILAIAETYVQMGDWQKAALKAQQVIQLKPDFLGAKVILAMAYQNTNREQQARKIYDEILKGDRITAGQAANNLAIMIAEKGGDLKYALSLAHMAAKNLNRNLGTLDTIGWVYFKLGEVDRAHKIFRLLVAKMPRQIEVRYHLAMVLAEMKSEDAISELEAVVKINPDSDYAWKANQKIKELQGKK